MPIIRPVRTLIFAITLLLTLAAIDTVAQERLRVPDLTVAGIKLGDRVSGKAFLGPYQPRTIDGPQPTYYFYNKAGDSVMKVTAASLDDPYFVTAIEVFEVADTYRKTHFYLDKINSFETESGIFIGWKQSKKGAATSLLLGIPYPMGIHQVGPGDVVKRKGEPTARRKTGKDETLDYRLNTANLGADNSAKFGYAAHFEFHKNDLQRFSLSLLAK